MTGISPASRVAALAEGLVEVARCGACGREQAMPSESCFFCGATELATQPHPGTGRIFSWTVTHFAFGEEFAGETPYTVLLVELEGSARLYGRLEPASHRDRLGPDRPVALDTALTRARGYPVFRLSEAGSVSAGP